MLNSSTHVFKSWRVSAKRAEHSATSLFLSMGLVMASLGIVPAYAQTPANQTSETVSSEIADGVYLYGQSEVPEQIGSAYMVFEAKQGQVVGAFYMPRSSFDCFYGNVEADQVALTVVDSYEQSLRPYSVALESSASIASASGQVDAPANLEGFHRINTLSDNDQRILSTCRTERQN